MLVFCAFGDLCFCARSCSFRKYLPHHVATPVRTAMNPTACVKRLSAIVLGTQRTREILLPFSPSFSGLAKSQDDSVRSSRNLQNVSSIFNSTGTGANEGCADDEGGDPLDRLRKRIALHERWDASLCMSLSPANDPDGKVEMVDVFSLTDMEDGDKHYFSPKHKPSEDTPRSKCPKGADGKLIPQSTGWNRLYRELQRAGHEGGSQIVCTSGPSAERRRCGLQCTFGRLSSLSSGQAVEGAFASHAQPRKVRRCAADESKELKAKAAGRGGTRKKGASTALDEGMCSEGSARAAKNHSAARLPTEEDKKCGVRLYVYEDLVLDRH